MLNNSQLDYIYIYIFIKLAMIVYKSLLKSFHKLIIPKTINRQLYTFTSQSPQRIKQLVSYQTLKKFQNLLEQNSQKSLQQGAQLLATLQLLVQNNDQHIKQLTYNLQTCPASTKLLIQKIQIVIDNIKQQQQQNQAIQKRAQKQLADCKNFSVSTIARQVLDVADSLGRCKKISLEHHRDQDHEVVQAINKADKQIKSIFQRYGIKQFDPTGQEYDPNLQEALATTPALHKDLKNKVAYTTRTGYTIKGRLLRSAHVGIYL